MSEAGPFEEFRICAKKQFRTGDDLWSDGEWLGQRQECNSRINFFA